MVVMLLYTTSFKVDSKKNLHGIFSLHGLEICDRRPKLTKAEAVELEFDLQE